jgi:6-pyruvoyl tetrahydropterin synthase/QueD family protein
VKLERRYEAEASHQLSAGVPDGHPCKRLHGHRYVFTVAVSGDIDPATGMILEYAEIDKAVNEVLAFIDHRFVNRLGEDVRVVGNVLVCELLTDQPNESELAQKVRENSTVENLAHWFVAELRVRWFNYRKKHTVGLRVPQAVSVRIEEDSRSVIELWVGEAP